MEQHAINFIQDLAVIMLIAGTVTVLFHRLKQPVVLGYIAAGILIGPYTPPVGLIEDIETVKTLSELGVIFLMFSLGLEFSLKKLVHVGITASIAALFEIILMLWLGYSMGQWFHWSSMDSLFLGAMLAISSTTIIVKALDELGIKHEHFAQLIFGVLIVEDILAIAMIVLLSGIAVSGSFDAGLAALTLGKLLLFIIVSLVLGILIVPRTLDYVASFKSKEILLISVLGLCFGFCLFVIKFNYSIALGAFLIGAMMAESRQRLTIEHIIRPLRDTFSAIFFVSIGILLDPRALTEYALPIILITFAVVIGKVCSCSLGTFIAGQDGRTSIHVGMGLAQIGEFSFIIASLGLALGVTSHFLYSIAVTVSALTTFLTPYLIRAADPLSQILARYIPRRIAYIFNLYTEWLQNIQPNKEQAAIRGMIRTIIFAIAINLAIVVAIFLGSAHFSDFFEQLLQPLVSEARTQAGIIWAASLFCSLPFLIAIHRKFKSLSMILVELSLPSNARYLAHTRRAISEILPALVMVSIMLLLAGLSSNILPSKEMLMLTALVTVVVVILLRRWFIRIHAQLQIALKETFSNNKEEE